MAAANRIYPSLGMKGWLGQAVLAHSRGEARECGFAGGKNKAAGASQWWARSHSTQTRRAEQI